MSLRKTLYQCAVEWCGKGDERTKSFSSSASLTHWNGKAFNVQPQELTVVEIPSTPVNWVWMTKRTNRAQLERGFLARLPCEAELGRCIMHSRSEERVCFSVTKQLFPLGWLVFSADAWWDISVGMKMEETSVVPSQDRHQYGPLYGPSAFE
jgi:hypothetical protein